MISVIEPALVWDDRSSGYQVRVTAGGAHTEKLEHGPRYGFGLFQHHEVSGMRQVDHSHPLAQLLTQRMPVPRRSRCIIEPLDHEKGGGPAAPPIFKGYVPAGREMREMDRRPAFDLFQYLGIGFWREPARANMVTQSLPFILTCVALRKGVPSGVGGPMRPPAASEPPTADRPPGSG